MQGQGVKWMTTTNAKVKKAKRKPLPQGVRIVLRMIGFLVFPVLCIVGLLVGLRIGYVQFGGGNPDDVLKWETWKHMLDLVFADT
jgi:hypothetical protein